MFWASKTWCPARASAQSLWPWESPNFTTWVSPKQGDGCPLELMWKTTFTWDFSAILFLAKPAVSSKQIVPSNGICRPWSHSTSSQWWKCGSLRSKLSSTMQHSYFGWRSVIHPNFCRPLSHSTSSKWWKCGSLRSKLSWTMQHSTFGWRSVRNPNFCRFFSHSPSSQWWKCGSFRTKRWWTVRHSTFEWRSVIHTNFCRR